MTPVLLVVDVQSEFIKESTEHMPAAIQEFAQEWKTLGGSIIATRFINRPDSQWVRLMDWERLISEEDTALVPEVERSQESTHSNPSDSFGPSSWVGVDETF